MVMIGCLYNFFFDLLLPWSIDNVFICIIFMGLGYMVRDKLNNGIKYTRTSMVLIIIISFLVTMVCGHVCGVVDICSGNYGNSYLLFFAGGFTGSIMLCGFSILLSELSYCKLLCKLGQNTLPIYALHLTVYEAIDVIGGIIDISNVNQGLVEVAKLIIAIVVLIPIIAIMNKYFPILVGKRRM